MSEVNTYTTPDNATFGNTNVVAVPANVGSADSQTPLLTFELDKGEYLVDGIAQFFHFVPGQDGVDYGVVSLLVEGSDDFGTAWTPDIPGDGNNAGQTNATTHLVISEDDTTVTLVGSIRGTHHGHAGAQAVVTQIG